MRRGWFRVVLILGAVARSAGADEVDLIGGEVLKIQSELQRLENRLVSSTTPVSSDDAAERLLIDAQVSYELKDYETAAIRLVDVVEKYPKSQAYPDALFFLADSLFYKRDYFSSRRYFEKLVEFGPQSPHYQEALQRLVELSLHTGDYSPVDGYITKLAGLPPERLRPSVPYVKGKYYYFRGKYSDAEAALKDIQPGHPYWFHSQYFVGAGLVAQGRLDEALRIFHAMVGAPAPKTEEQKRILELAHLALARIYYEQGQLTNALDEYAKVSLRSDLFPDALYEQAWVSIKAKDYKSAFRSLETLLTLKPDDPLVPEIKLLIGNLHVRQGEFDEARESFTKTRDEFEPIHKQLKASQAETSESYFRELIGKNLGKFDASTYLPPLALKWVRQEPDMERLISLVGDVNELKKSLEEADGIVRRVEKAIAGPQRINIYPELASARAEVTMLLGRLAEAERKLIVAESALLRPIASAKEREEMERLAQERARIEQQLASAPATTASATERQQYVRAQFDELDKQAAVLQAQLQNYSAVRVGVEVYYANLLEQKQIKPSQSERDSAARELADAKAEGERLRQLLERLHQDITDAIATLGAYDIDTQQQEELRNRLAAVIAQEHDLGSSLRARLTGAERVKADQMASILDRGRSAHRQIARFTSKIEDAVEERLRDLRLGLAEEKAHVAEYQRVLGGYEGETVDVGAGVTAESFRTIVNRFYNIVVRSDVGIIDVAWALKDAKTQENARLLREKQRDLKLLDDEFKPALKE